MRINARMDEESRQALDFIKQTTGESTTEALKHALAIYAEQLGQRRSPGEKMRAFLAGGFVGCTEGPEDGSDRYKDYVHGALDQKYGDR